MAHSIAELCERFAELVLSARNTNGEFAQICGIEAVAPDSLIFVSEAEHLPAEMPAAVVTTAELAEDLPQNACVICVADVRLAQALIKQQYQDYQSVDDEWPVVHPSAVIHPSAELAEDVRVGPNSVIGARVRIGAGTVVRANCVIEHDSQIGENNVIHNLVNIGYGCVLGDRVIVRAGVIIGGEGFGWVPDAQRHYHRLPHTGGVTLHDDVQVGANCNIDRGTYGQTVLSRGVKLDALVHVAHNVVVGEDAILLSLTGVSGSSKIGKRAILTGQTGVLDHRSIADDAILVHRCGVTQDIPTAGTWAGTPAKPLKEYVRGISLSKQVDKLQRQLKALLRERDND